METVAVIPAYNEETHIGRVVEETKKYVDSVIVVDDGSSDNTTNEAERRGALVLRHIVNMGKGFALRTGCEKAAETAGLIVVLDADGQHDPSDIPRMIEALMSGEKDIIIGSRPKDRNMPPIARLGNWWINSLSKALFGLNVRDTQSGYRVFRKEAYEKIVWKSRGYFVEMEMIINASKHKLKYMEVPIKTVYHDRHKGTTVMDGVRISMNMLSHKVRR